MKATKIVFATLPFVLAGCTDIFNDEEPVVHYPPYPPEAPAPQPVIHVPNPKPKVAGCDCPVEIVSPVPSIPSSALPAPSSVGEPAVKPDPAWQPTEGHLVRAGDLLMELQRKHGGRRPPHGEMMSYLQEKMHLTMNQAEIIIEELGV